MILASGKFLSVREATPTNLLPLIQAGTKFGCQKLGIARRKPGCGTGSCVRSPSNRTDADAAS